jgi:pimeloyl-ACP methyl ester carboxylesterase
MDSTVPLLVLPGHLCNGRLFTNQITHLNDVAEFTVADLYGADSVQELASHAIRSMTDRFAILANSMGGSVAFEIMRQNSERVIGLALVGTTARPEWPAQNARRQPAAKLAAEGKFGAVAEMYAPVFFHPARTQNGAHVRTLELMIAEAGYVGLQNQQAAFSSRPDSRSDLKVINCPTLVLCGRDDIITPPEMSEEIASGIQGAQLMFLDTCGHIPMLEWPDLTTDVLRKWIKELQN